MDQGQLDSTTQDEQSRLAYERTLLAHERTLMAWVRTATSLITFGFVLYKFFFYLRQEGQIQQIHQFLGPRIVGSIMIGIGLITLAMATWKHRQPTRSLREKYPDAPFSLSLLVAALVSGLGILAFVATIYRQ